jgi:hypothetical protein
MARSQIRSKSWYGKLYQLLPPGAPEMNAQIVRLIVLFEDIKIEVAAANSEKTPFDFIGADYRLIYFVRGALQTLREVHSALEALDRDDDFRSRVLKSASPENKKQWKAAVKFFAKNIETLRAARNAVGGHFSRSAGQIAATSVPTDATVKIVITANDSRTGAGIAFHNAIDFVGAAFTPKGVQDPPKVYVERLFETLKDAFAHHANVMNGIISSWALSSLGYEEPRVD